MEYLRVATTFLERQSKTVNGPASPSRPARTVNGLYVLDMSLRVVGKVENLAPGERIYSVRFMGGKAYLVTFKKVDPLFVVELENPVEPRVLGQLKIPGYSSYLHPYDDTHLIGLGKDAKPAEEGDFMVSGVEDIPLRRQRLHKPQGAGHVDTWRQGNRIRGPAQP